jgi:hypothetical protein
MANLIVEAVRQDQTGVATGMNKIVRTIGGAIGAQITASILAAHVTNGEPAESGYTIAFATCAAVVAAGLVASIAVPSRRARYRHTALVEAEATTD